MEERFKWDICRLKTCDFERFCVCWCGVKSRPILEMMKERCIYHSTRASLRSQRESPHLFDTQPTIVGFCQRTDRQRANHTISREKGGDYHTMASSQDVLSDGKRKRKRKGLVVPYLFLENVWLDGVSWFTGRNPQSYSQSNLWAYASVQDCSIPATQSQKRAVGTITQWPQARACWMGGWKRDERVGFDGRMVCKWVSWRGLQQQLMPATCTHPSCVRGNRVCINSCVLLQAQSDHNFALVFFFNHHFLHCPLAFVPYWKTGPGVMLWLLRSISSTFFPYSQWLLVKSASILWSLNVIIFLDYYYLCDTIWYVRNMSCCIV